MAGVTKADFLCSRFSSPQSTSFVSRPFPSQLNVGLAKGLRYVRHVTALGRPAFGHSTLLLYISAISNPPVGSLVIELAVKPRYLGSYHSLFLSPLVSVYPGIYVLLPQLMTPKPFSDTGIQCKSRNSALYPACDELWKRGLWKGHPCRSLPTLHLKLPVISRPDQTSSPSDPSPIHYPSLLHPP